MRAQFTHSNMRFLILSAAALLAACSSTPKLESSTGAPTQLTSQQASTSSSGSAANTSVTVSAPVVTPEAQQKFDAAMQLVNAGKQDEAALQLEQLANAYPTLSTPLINLGLLYLKNRQFDAAVRAFTQALERDAKSPPAHNYLGVSYRNLGKFKDAEAQYQAAIAADDTYAAAHLNLGVLYDLYLQQPEQALSEYERYQALQATPDTKVAGWIKELKSRTAGNKAKVVNADAAGDKS